MGTKGLLREDDRDDGQKHAAVANRWEPNPALAEKECVEGQHVEGPEKQHIPPDGDFPPGGSGHQKWVVVLAIPVDEVDHDWWWPEGVLKVSRVSNNDLLDVDNIRDKGKVEQEEHHHARIQPTIGW